jgi:hydroxyacylglutathione hydrolase
MKIQYFTFNDFQENTYIVYDDISKKCIIIDPGNSNSRENSILKKFIEEHQLLPKKLINTHCHIDHILGNDYVANQYGLPLESHAGEVPVLDAGERVAQMYGIAYTTSPPITKFLEEGDTVLLDNLSFKILFCPGHSPASICLYSEAAKTLIAGDVLFHRSIGRTDLPGGDFNTLINSIKSKLFVLSDDTIVYPGHGISTTIGEEKKMNPFLND